MIASGTLDGEELQASMLLFPAATAKVTPAAMADDTAASNVEDFGPPRDILERLEGELKLEVLSNGRLFSVCC